MRSDFNAEQTQTLLKKWEKITYNFKRYNYSFEKRLEELGLKIEDLGSYFSSLNQKFNGHQPLNFTCLEHTSVSNDFNLDQAYAPIIQWAIVQLGFQQCFPGFVEVLNKEISQITSRVLDLELKNFQIESNSNSDYKLFLNYFKDYTAWEKLFVKYPVLEYVLIIRINQLTTYYQEILTHFRQDRLELEEKGFIAEEAVLVNIEFGLSDPHRGGKTVACFSFQNGGKLIYKPHSLGLERAFQLVIDWFNKTSDKIICPLNHTLDKGDYGWAAYLDHIGFASEDDVDAYFYRLGQLNALFFFLGATDMHPNNFVQQGQYPIPIDLECLLSPIQTHASSDYATLGSCLYTGMSPYWYLSKDRSHVFYSLGIEDSSRLLPYPTPKTVNQQTRDQRVVFAYQTSENAKLYEFNDKRINPLAYRENLLNGFENLYKLIYTHKEELLAENSPLNHFKNLESRLLLRGTKEYRQTLFFTLAPNNLKSFADYVVATERIYSHNPIFNNGQAYSKVIESEKTSLYERDIPVFVGNTSGTTLKNDRYDLIGDIIDRSPFEQMIERIQYSSIEKLKFQLDLLKASYEMIRISNEELPTNRLLAGEKGRSYEAVIKGIIAKLERLAIQTDQGTAWLDIYPEDPNAIYANLVVCTPNNYAGTAGVGYFLIQAATTFNNYDWRNLAKDAIRFGLNQSLKNMTTYGGGVISLSAFEGVFSVIYSALCWLNYWQDKDLEKQVLKLLSLVKNDDFESQPLDYLGGISGAILVLMKAVDYFKSTSLNNMLVVLCDRLIAKLPTVANQKTGMAHGAAGYAYTLLIMYKRFSKEKYLQLAVEYLDIEMNYWIDRIQKAKSVKKKGTWWCNGLPGVGMACLTFVQEGCGDKYLNFLNEITTEICKQSIPHKDHLCCGKSGRLVFLIKASQLLGDDNLLKIAHKEAVEMLKRNDDSGKWHYQQLSEGTIIPGLFNGASGIAYALLALQNPAISNILTLE